jgi:5-oxoprolinase (ATP-hydrolysing)
MRACVTPPATRAVRHGRRRRRRARLNLLLRRDGRGINFGGKNTCAVEPGDWMRVLTPGCGGWGVPATCSMQISPLLPVNDRARFSTV